MTETATTRVGSNRGRPRIWLDGKRLERAGFTPGTFYWCRSEPGRIELIHFWVDSGRDRDLAVKEGWASRSVSGRPGGKPIIDMVGATVGTAMGDATHALVTFEQGVITIVPA